MGNKANPKIERVLALVEPGRRDALRKILATAAYAAPVVASFSLDAEAGLLPVSCIAANQTCLSVLGFSGTAKCKGLRLDRASFGLVPQPVDLTLLVQLVLCEGPTGGLGRILGGPMSLVDPRIVTFTQATFDRAKDEVLGFAIADCLLGYYETGQWIHTLDKSGIEKLKGKSWVMIVPDAADAGIAYTLECDYNLSSVAPVLCPFPGSRLPCSPATMTRGVRY